LSGSDRRCWGPAISEMGMYSDRQGTSVLDSGDISSSLSFTEDFAKPFLR